MRSHEWTMESKQHLQERSFLVTRGLRSHWNIMFLFKKKFSDVRQKKHVDISGYYNINVFAKKKRYAGTQTDLPSDPLTCQNKIFYMDVVKMLKRHSIKLQIIPKIRGPQDVITILPNQQGLKTD